MTYSKEYIAGLIEKFMNGETSLEEEKVLNEYFTGGTEIPPEWKDYKAMFEYFDNGMSEKAASRSHGNIFMKNSWKKIAAACAAAACVGIGLVLFSPREKAPENVTAMEVRDSIVQQDVAVPAAIEQAPVAVHKASAPKPHQAAVKSVRAEKEDKEAEDALADKVRRQVMEIARQQAEAQIIDAVMASSGFVRVKTENGGETYVNEQNTIAL